MKHIAQLVLCFMLFQGMMCIAQNDISKVVPETVEVELLAFILE